MKTPEGGGKAASAVKEYSGSDLRLQRQTGWSELHTVARLESSGRRGSLPSIGLSSSSLEQPSSATLCQS